ncbi:uncharacterized protein LOC119604807 [Lucilia sericata]|uniref:uncharacterized protein LOC119604807 n=1 Tax=Lucilia sericata TaxID=13632 RepID=UPI0018A84929|nr:uncharacterized protein LOC119604807 [Lucilia sericata]XP_037813594.1 uncharacterized protein LOC119604807 [Lucilia sericata]XP_037813595.1 uncharacterized protein LOC119604807 [Lucilia sericata]XP_037813596.1 uncharacterized protein LOC119604807 [Lucilia sericata]XP_037813597.1 uncharacterized protein LOC119604807 [Lucilia sericata]
MSMLGFVYLVLILGWILIVLFLKCKKSITPHIGLTDNYTDAIGSDQRRPSVHVIQLQRDDLDNEDQSIDAYQQRSSSLRRQSQRIPLSAIGERNIETTYPTEAVVNPAYIHDEEYIINAPPPSYDEVMRQPEIYPKVTNKISSVNI